MSSPWPAPSVASRSSTTPSARRAAAPPWSPPTSRTTRRFDRLGAALFERFRKLDILIGNGGMLGKLNAAPCRSQALGRG